MSQLTEGLECLLCRGFTPWSGGKVPEECPHCHAKADDRRAHEMRPFVPYIMQRVSEATPESRKEVDSGEA